ncbi:beta-propeller domain-containing protein [Actinophytocola gossypii]|uniref:Beta-propeller domain-containing protein n=1 Tax=Actinophytocola gossypii TaxID=2812003 RepID=A0ABT2JGL1_9PSEU|nr:beta-propeller domain-containing protein [Actinophytocola gossypii]MCT2587017.1 beta-propeller domain-containing protein [Actinophytocola gossypii]
MRTDLPRWPRLAVAAAAVVGLGAGVAGTAVVIGLGDEDDDPPSTRTYDGPVELIAYDDCDSALAELKAAALPHVGPYGLLGEAYPDGAVVAEDGAVAADGRAAAAEAAPGAAPNAAPGAAPGAASGAQERAVPEHSGTNVHESGVDEPDLVKTDGRRVVTVTGDTLTVVDVASREPTASLTLPTGGHAGQLLLDGDRALVMTTGYPHAFPAEPAPGRSPAGGTRLVLVDLTGDGEVLGDLQVSGSYLDARQVGPVARVVVRSMPRLPFDHSGPVLGAEERHRGVVENSSIDDWLPRYTLDTGDSTSSGRLVECGAVSHPHRYTGASMLTILTVDLREELTIGDPVSIAADGDTVYGTGTSLYVADDHYAGGISEKHPMPEDAQRTEVYQFDISKPGKPVHVASGGVEGSLLNQYALSEHEGHLRIATTVGFAPDTRSMVSVLTRRGDELALVGRVDGLGAGERIYSVRYLGDVAYVVTFRETDPLYTVDLSDPARPLVTGELKITGYSAYLHPVGDNSLLGVGQEATTDGATTGLQVSLFDTSSPEAARVGTFHVPGGYSEVEHDPHAFLYWPAENLVVLPVTGTSDAGALVLRISGDRLTEAGTVEHGDGTFRRALVIGEELWTVSDGTVVVSTLADLDLLATVQLG